MSFSLHDTLPTPLNREFKLTQSALSPTYPETQHDIVMLTDSQLHVVEFTVPMNSLSTIAAAKVRYKNSSPTIAYSIRRLRINHLTAA